MQSTVNYFIFTTKLFMLFELRNIYSNHRSFLCTIYTVGMTRQNLLLQGLFSGRSFLSFPKARPERYTHKPISYIREWPWKRFALYKIRGFPFFVLVRPNFDMSQQPDFAVKFHEIPKSKLDSFKELFTGCTDGLVRSEPGGYVMSPTYGQNAEKIFRMQPRSDDIWLLTFPKCGIANWYSISSNTYASLNILYTGTTWTAELLWLLANNCDFETAAKNLLGSRTIFIE